MHARSFDVALGHGRLEFDALGEIGQCIGVLAGQIPERPSHVVGEGLQIAETAGIDRQIKGLGSFLVTICGLPPDRV